MTRSFFVGGAHRANEIQRELVTTEEQLDVLERRLEEAKGAAARADKTAEDLYQDLLSHKDCAEKRYRRVCKLEQQVQAQNNTISMLDSRIERMNVAIREKDQEIRELKDTIDCQDEDLKQLRAQREQQRLSEEMRSRHIEHLEQCNENQRQLIQTLRERVGAAAGTAGEVIEVIDALLGDGGGFCGVWDPDVENFADALKAKLREEP